MSRLPVLPGGPAAWQTRLLNPSRTASVIGGTNHNRMPTFATETIQFHYLEKGSGLPFFFQHGLGADVSQPFGLFQPPPGIRLIGMDVRAHGLTRPAGPREKIGLATFADDLVALMDFLSVSKAIAGGISMGAAVALNLALRYPNRVLGLVLSRPAWIDGPNPWNVQMFSLVSRLIREYGARRGQELFKETSEYADLMRTYPDTANSLVRQFDHPLAEENAVNLEGIPRDTPSSNRHDWAGIQVPTLVLANRQDPIHPFHFGEVLARAIPGAEFKEITSKSLNAEQHGRDVQRFIESFLQRNFLAERRD
jgi:pimeloyl-ACP methyl ester carboxylesterase